MAYADQNRRYDDPGRDVPADRRGTPAARREREPHDAPGAAARRPARDAAGRPPVQPAHPLPEHRTGTIDYDRYLERSTDKFKIFSAAERRRRKRAVATGAAIVAAVAIIVIWAILSQPV